jgi:hypothetical protein
VDLDAAVGYLLERFGFDVVDLAGRVDAAFCAFAWLSTFFGSSYSPASILSL